MLKTCALGFSALIAALLVVRSATAAEQTITRYYSRGLRAVTVPLESATIRTARDLAALFDSPFVTRTHNGRFETYVAGARNFDLAGNKGYLLFCPWARMIPWSGRPWSAGQLKVNLASGFEIIANPRRSEGPLLWNFYEETRLQFLGHLLLDAHGRPSWSPSLLRGFDTSGSNLFVPNLAYAIIRVGSPQTVVLPNTNQRPWASLDGAPLSATTGTTIPVVSWRSSDRDDDPTNLLYQWSLSAVSGGDAVTTTGNPQALLTAAESGAYVLSLAVSDGLAEHRATQSIAIIPRATATSEKLLYGFRLQPISNALGVDLPTLFQSNAGLFTDTTDNQPALSLTADHAVTSTDFNVEAKPSGALRTLSLTPLQSYWKGAVIETNVTTVAIDSTEVVTQPELYDLLLESTVTDGENRRTVHFFGNTQRTGSATKMSKDGRIATFKRAIAAKLHRFRPTRIVPVSLANRVDARLGYAVIPVNPSLPLGNRTAVLLLPGWNPKAEVCLEGAPAYQRLITWSPLLGTDADHRYQWPGLAENIASLEKDYAFYRCQYPTIRAPSEIARRLAREIEKVILRENPTAPMILIGYSMGGLVARWLRNEIGATEKRLGEQVPWVITIATPHHGTDIASYLPVMFTQGGASVAPQRSEQFYWPLLDIGCIPPSPGMAVLRLDGLVPHDPMHSTLPNTGLPFIPDNRRSSELGEFNTARDAYAAMPNLVCLAGGTKYNRLGNEFYQLLRLNLYYFATSIIPLPWMGYNDGVVGTKSSIPSDIGGAIKGSWNRHLGRESNGSMDRVAYFEGFDHSMIFSHIDPITVIHNFLSEMATSNRPPVASPATVILTSPWREDQRAPYPQTRISVGPNTVSDPDGDALTHHWSVERIDPPQNVSLEGSTTSEPALLVAAPGNILMKHIMRDSRGGIAWQIVSVNVHNPRDACGEFWRYLFGGGARPSIEPRQSVVDGRIRVDTGATSCIPIIDGGYRAWVDPFNPDTELMSWAREPYGYYSQGIWIVYDGPSLGYREPVRSNFAYAAPIGSIDSPP